MRRFEEGLAFYFTTKASHCCLSPKTEGYRQGLPPPRPAAVTRAYVSSKKEATTSNMVVTGTFF